MGVSVFLLYAVTVLGVAASDNCADKCSCKWKSGKRTVECVNRDLTSIPDWIDQETQVLDMSGNNIGHLPNNIFIHVRLTNLQRLYLRECRIDRIDGKALAGLTNLVELDLSNNLLAAVPSSSFADTPFLRDLVLAYNPLKRIRAHTFKNTLNLVKLDLSHTQLGEIEAKGFRGLEMLESLKLSNNVLSTLHSGTFDPLSKLTSIELHDNPWICDCHLREMKMWLVKHNLPTIVAPVCHGPQQLLNRAFTDLDIDDFACRPVLMIASRYAEATIGENASIVCRVSAIPPAKIKWYWNGRLLANHSAFSSHQKILIFEEGQFRKRSTLVLTNAQEADSSEFYCIAENPAGCVEANFTLHVSLRTAGMSTLGSGQIAGISAALVVLILFILLIILVLFIRLRRMPLKDVKSSAPMEAASSDGIGNGSSGGGGVGSGGGGGGGGSGGGDNNPPSATSTTRRKHEEIETTSFALESKPPASLHLSYVQRPHAAVVQASEYSTISRYDDPSQPAVAAMPGAGCFSSTTSLMPIDNPDLIRDTRRGSTEDITPYGVADYGRVEALDDAGKMLYTSCLWEARDSCGRTSAVTTNVYPSSKEQLAMVAPVVEQFPPGAKQMRVWQKGVPVLPPVSALKRVLGSTRSSPDEGYQEGTGTDV
ncbi:leucine-rich repeat, immunoglobulin-like domain and transmembrane domain-containing protein 2 [Monomorium pharaonis]|uniref:leucine-rich repeat, immunoglobulin-like domain and transmembrane domain-containing protein 2 n=1 Tax=Monomorium pharaonis TaxID=307658 RepID=UPI001746CE2D|nr:leucine-rich repeat, immunoglobulin-like domain and transmembrane domain-containing protein 2 [Monomorium pharaonis]